MECPKPLWINSGRQESPQFFIMNCVAIGRKESIDFIEKAPLEILSDTVPSQIQQAKVIAVYEAAKTTWHVEAKLASEWQVNSLPPQLQDMEVEACVKIYDAAKFEELAPDTAPSRAYLAEDRGDHRVLQSRVFVQCHKLDQTGHQPSKRFVR